MFSDLELDAFREAGRISALARDRAAAQARPGVLLRHVQEHAEEVIREAGAAPSFPAQTSRNQVAAHYCSSPEDNARFEEGDLVKVDVGAHIDGYPADTGVSVDLSLDGHWSGLIGAASEALDAAIASVRHGVRVGRIGSIIESAIKAAGFRPIANLSGHGLDRWSLHAAPQIPNVAIAGGSTLRTGAVFAIEPFSTTGAGFVNETGIAEVFSQDAPDLPRGGSDPDDSCFTGIESWHGLPFARRYFPDAPRKRLEECLRDLTRCGAVHAYRPLIEVSGGMVAWKEHTIYLGESGAEILTQGSP